MTFRIPLLALAALLIPASAIASGAFTSIHPEDAYPDNLKPMASPGPYSDFIKQVQEKLHHEGFDAGPINGDFGTKTQAALAQFQLSQGVPASGALDNPMLNELGIQPPDAQASSDAAAGSSATR